MPKKSYTCDITRGKGEEGGSGHPGENEENEEGSEGGEEGNPGENEENEPFHCIAFKNNANISAKMTSIFCSVLFGSRKIIF